MTHPIAAGKSSFDLVDAPTVFEELGLKPQTVMLDVACGVGRYSLAAAEIVRGEGKIYAFDLWEEGIAALKESAAAAGLLQVDARVADVCAPLPLPVGRIDAVLMATVLHDFVFEGGGERALREVARLLRPGGRLVVVEFEKVESTPGPPVAIRLSPQEVEALVSPCGFRSLGKRKVGEALYLLCFEKEGG